MLEVGIWSFRFEKATDVGMGPSRPATREKLDIPHAFNL
jgi:hypothetical protein